MALRSEAEILGDLRRLCTSPGYIHLFAALVVQNTYVMFTEGIKGADFDATFSGDHLIRTELSTLLGLIVQAPIDNSHPTQEGIGRMEARTHELLEELHHKLSAELRPRPGSASMDAFKGIDFSQGAVLREPMFYTGESAYSFQYRDFAPVKYREDEEWLTRKMCFTISQAANVGRAIFKIQKRRLEEVWNSLRHGVGEEFTCLPAFVVDTEEIVAAVSEDRDVVLKVLEAFSLPEDSRNETFKSLGDYNVVNARPMLRRDAQSYLCFQAYSFYEALYESPFYWMIDDLAYKDESDEHRGSFTEEFSRERLAKVFGAKHTYMNALIVNRSGDTTGEIDVLVVFGNRAIVLQAKSKRLTIKARKGNDQAIKADIEASIVKSYEQALDCAQRLLRRDERVLDGLGREIKIPELKKVYLMCVVSEHYPALSFQAAEFLSVTISKEIPAPFVTDVFTLDAMAEMLESPLRLLSYIDLRTRYGEKIKSGHEMTILGFHLSKNLWVAPDLSVVYLDDSFANDLSAAMAVRRDNIEGVRTPPGILTVMKASIFEDVVSQLEHQPRGQLVDVGLMLLETSSNAAKEFSNAVEFTRLRARENGQSDASLGHREGGGITIHSNFLPIHEGLERLEVHAAIKKYRAKTNSWFGLGIHPYTGTVLFGVNLEAEWEKDETMESASKAFPPDRPVSFVNGRTQVKEVGRNDPCPCGSGKKYKKCHLDAESRT
jgi:hypothetical protein